MIKRSNSYILLALFISFTLTAFWFHDKRIVAIAEEGLIFYNPARTFSLYKSLWFDIGFGSAAPFYVPRLILFGFNAALYKMGMPGWLIQQVVFSVLLMVPLIFLPKITKLLVPGKTNLLGVIASLFYVFNLFTLSQVWERFIYPLIFLWSYLPLLLYLWIRWNKEHSVKHLLVLIVTSVIFADAFGLTSSFLTISFVLISYVIFLPFGKKGYIKSLLWGFCGYMVWAFTQLWWIVPIYQLRNDRYSSFINTDNTLRSLSDVSKYFPSTQIILLKQGYFFGESNFLAYFYNKPVVFGFGCFIAFLVVVGSIVNIQYKSTKYLLLLLLIGWFVAKGTNPPLGYEFYRMLFTKIPFTQILRNPYEKFGVVFLLSYSILFAHGLLYIIPTKSRPLKILSLCIVSVVTFGLYVWPLWTGDVFARAKIAVPSYYAEANTFLLQYDKRRILSLPLLQESSIEYTWTYRGEDPSEFLFDRPILARSDFGSPTDEFYLSFPKYFSEKNFSNILSVSAVTSIVIRKDTFQNRFNQSSISDYLSEVQNWKNINSKKEFGDLTVFTLNKDAVVPWVYSVNKLISVESIKKGMEIMINDDFDPQAHAIFVRSDQNNLKIPETLLAPYLSFIKQSSVKYTAHITNAAKPFVLILAVSYNPIWKATNQKKIFSNHFKVNGYANGWLIDKKGTYDIKISFRP